MLLGIIISCGSPTMSSNVGKNDLKEAVQNSETTFVDVRVPEQFKENTVKNAVNIPLAEVENNLEFFRKQKKVVVFCNSGNQSNQALEILKKNGITNVYDGKTVNNVEEIKSEK